MIAVAGCADVPDLVTAPVLRSWEEIVAESAPDTPNTEEQLDVCPIELHDALIEDAVRLTDTDAVRSALDGREVSYVTSTADELPAALVCALVGDGAVASLTVTASPADLDSYLSARGERLGRRLEIDESGPFRGGRFQHICSVDDGDGVGLCEVAWIDRNVLIGVSVFGPAGDDLDTADVEEQFRLVVPLVVGRLS